MPGIRWERGSSVPRLLGSSGIPADQVVNPKGNVDLPTRGDIKDKKPEGSTEPPGLLAPKRSRAVLTLHGNSPRQMNSPSKESCANNRWGRDVIEKKRAYDSGALM